jgi:hypothetical protein
MFPGLHSFIETFVLFQKKEQNFGISLKTAASFRGVPDPHSDNPD